MMTRMGLGTLWLGLALGALSPLGCAGPGDVDSGPGDGDGDGDADGGDGDPDGGDVGELCDEVGGGVQYDHEVLQFEAEGGGEVLLTRDYVDWGVGESVLYEAVRLTVRIGDVDFCVTDPGALAYENSHHNWADRADATFEGRRYHLVMDYNFITPDAPPWSDVLHVYDAVTDEEVAGPYVLTYVAGVRYP